MRENFGAQADYLVWGTADEEAYRDADIGWICQGRLYLQGPYHPLQSLHTYFFAVTRRGEFAMRPDGQAEFVMIVPQHYDQKEQVGASAYLQVPLLAISFLHCKNVAVSDVVPPPKLARAQEKKYGVPKVTYKVLDIKPMRRVLDDEGGMARGRSTQQALHIVRGHFKTFDEHPLFGKHRGMFWWPMTARGAAEGGITAKSYRVSVPPEATAPK